MQESPLPDPTPGTLLVRTECSLISPGTELKVPEGEATTLDPTPRVVLMWRGP